MSSPVPIDVTTILPSLGATAEDESIRALLERIGEASSPGQGLPSPHVTAFPDGSFHNFYTVGISLFYAAASSTSGDSLRLDRIDFYNPAREDTPTPTPGPSRRHRKPTAAYSSSPPLIFNFPSTNLPIPAPPARDPNLPAPTPKTQSNPTAPSPISRPKCLIVDQKTTARSLVECFGEPSKKGGTIGWLDTYMEWEVEVLDSQGATAKVGVLVELREGGGEGMNVWDRASGWEWACLKIFSPT